MLAAGAHLEILLQFGLGDDLPARRALGPQTLGDIALDFRPDLESRFLENSHGFFLSAGDRDDNHRGSPGLAQDPRAGVSRRTRGEDVIDQNQVPSGHIRASPQGESPFQILEPLIAMKMGLGQSVTCPLQTIIHRQTET
jgi:hypothetical protein